MRVDSVAEEHIDLEHQPGGTVGLLDVVMVSALLERLRTPDLDDQH